MESWIGDFDWSHGLETLTGFMDWRLWLESWSRLLEWKKRRETLKWNGKFNFGDEICLGVKDTIAKRERVTTNA